MDKLRLNWLLVSLLLSGVSAGAEQTQALRQADPAETYLRAFRGGDFRQAQIVARTALDDGADPATWWGCLGAAAARADDPEGAVDAVVRAQRLGARLDQDVLTLYVTALGRIQVYVQARTNLDTLARRFPYTPLAARDARLGVAIDRRLAEPISGESVTWQIAAASSALAHGRPGLALIHAEEGRLLAHRAGLPWPVAGIQIRATVLLDLGDPDAAEAALADVTDGESAGRIGLLRATAQLAGGRREAARATLDRLESTAQAGAAKDDGLAANLKELRRILGPFPTLPRIP